MCIITADRRWRFVHFIYSPQVSHTHAGGLAQDKSKSFHPEKAVRQAPKGTASFTLYTSHSIISSLLIEPVAETLCLVWHLVADINISASRKNPPSLCQCSILIANSENVMDMKILLVVYLIICKWLGLVTVPFTNVQNMNIQNKID